MEHTLTEFEQWCEGKGRGECSGRHYSALDAIQRFRAFKAYQKQKQLDREFDRKAGTE